MSYIIKSTEPFASTKVTEVGREKLSKGQLNFTSWSIGDSEINYDREIYTQGGTITGTTAMVLRPKDRQPDLKYFINSGGSNKFTFDSGDVRCVKLTVNNEAKERGPFSGDTINGFTTLTEGEIPNYVRGSGPSISLNGGNSIDLSVSGVIVGDFVLFKLGYGDLSNDNPTPHIFFKVQNVNGTALTLDRNLPSGGNNASFVIYKGGNIYDNESDSISYWDTGTLSFDSSCDISAMDVPLWNMNIPFSETILGVTDDNYEKNINFGSYNYIGEKDNYLYNNSEYLKSSAIIHYSNKTISNVYGEFFFIDNKGKNVKLHLPDLMYHRRNFSGSGNGDKMGMTFVSSGATVSVGSNGLKYIPLIEEATLVDGIPKQVGRVYPNLKIVTIDDPEIIGAMSYKSNRNWTLPKLNLTLTNPSGGPSTGMLETNKTLYVTYRLDNEGSGIQPTLPCQYYSKIENTGSSSKDVQFNIENLELFPYLMNNNSSGGFYADNFQILFQITDGERPETDKWKEIDFSSSVKSGNFIDAFKLEIQNPNASPNLGSPIFQLTQTNVNGASLYSILNKLGMPTKTEPDMLQFGDERFFYGNIEAYIGATIFKTIFKVAINASDFNKTTNTTRSGDITTNPPNIKVSEVGIYDSDGDLVVISKLSVPVELTPGKTVILELSIDF